MAVTYVRTSITLPPELVDAADRRARELDRSRSWVIAEALRRYVAEPGSGVVAHPGRVNEPSAHPYAASEVAEARRRHLAAELALPPAERLRRAEELGNLARQAQKRGRRHQVIGFDSYEDYYEWKKGQLIGL